ncbi:hypothetical protein BK133_26860 [Paenibacillus sp. FSL H8-0548]|uniref:hypothetical protein n=1 Tax=Paenibacillus sp. FSL H8-0548 TaxID=1920422 RepID=UPI00096FBD15|nr:hypothetical protein [Paenibacillus sp. FSL H8-0548]OMF22189.1 hypothetical protein BK133_26860 [Paenibacillus sp. FSL H8-0548]
MITAFIVSCEIGFWVFVLAGLICRYIFRLKKLGILLLYSTPLIDLALVIATVIDLRGGAIATFAHSLAAVYIGVSIAYGHRMIKWADERFAHRFAGGPAPFRKPKYGKEHARYERNGWLHHLLAFVIGSALLYGMIIMVGDEARTEALWSTLQLWAVILGIDFLISFSYTLSPRKKKPLV